MLFEITHEIELNEHLRDSVYSSQFLEGFYSKLKVEKINVYSNFEKYTQ